MKPSAEWMVKECLQRTSSFSVWLISLHKGCHLLPEAQRLWLMCLIFSFLLSLKKHHFLRVRTFFRLMLKARELSGFTDTH